MTKTQKIVEVLNGAQRTAIVSLCGELLSPVPKRKAWYYTDSRCRKDTSQVLCVNGLCQIDELGGKTVVTPTGMGKRVAKYLDK
jgi:hypothetical protein